MSERATRRPCSRPIPGLVAAELIPVREVCTNDSISDARSRNLSVAEFVLSTSAGVAELCQNGSGEEEETVRKVDERARRGCSRQCVPVKTRDSTHVRSLARSFAYLLALHLAHTNVRSFRVSSERTSRVDTRGASRNERVRLRNRSVVPCRGSPYPLPSVGPNGLSCDSLGRKTRHCRSHRRLRPRASPSSVVEFLFSLSSVARPRECGCDVRV